MFPVRHRGTNCIHAASHTGNTANLYPNEFSNGRAHNADADHCAVYNRPDDCTDARRLQRDHAFGMLRCWRHIHHANNFDIGNVHVDL
jgi:hypothetical protein